METNSERKIWEKIITGNFLEQLNRKSEGRWGTW